MPCSATSFGVSQLASHIAARCPSGSAPAVLSAFSARSKSARSSSAVRLAGVRWV